MGSVDRCCSARAAAAFLHVACLHAIGTGGPLSSERMQIKTYIPGQTPCVEPRAVAHFPVPAFLLSNSGWSASSEQAAFRRIKETQSDTETLPSNHAHLFLKSPSSRSLEPDFLSCPCPPDPRLVSAAGAI